MVNNVGKATVPAVDVAAQLKPSVLESIRGRRSGWRSCWGHCFRNPSSAHRMLRRAWQVSKNDHWSPFTGENLKRSFLAIPTVSHVPLGNILTLVPPPHKHAWIASVAHFVLLIALDQRILCSAYATTFLSNVIPPGKR